MSKFRFYFLSFTWGLPMTLIGGFTALVLIIAGFKPQKYGYIWRFEIGNDWGGINLGLIIITDKTPSNSTLYHEYGHSIQNCCWGILMPFVICVPSSIRYQYREYLHKVKKIQYADMPDYDSVWYERNATMRGTRFIKELEKLKNED